jgi:hypothetical protein
MKVAGMERVVINHASLSKRENPRKRQAELSIRYSNLQVLFSQKMR